MYTIGEFSRISGLTIKTLRFYHDEGILAPRSVDGATGYRYYSDDQVETARAITLLRGLDFSLVDVRDILARQVTGETFVATLERHRADLERKLKRTRAALRTLDRWIAEERTANLNLTTGKIQVKHLESTLIAGIRICGRYSESGRAFGRIGRKLGRYIAGPAFLLHYDCEFKEYDADFEACMPIRAPKKIDGISVREHPGGPAICLLHRGPYDEMGRSYARLLKHVGQEQREIVMPTREIYLKCQGLIFKGNPRHYLTEIQIPVAAEAR